jgi:hypothetical protein
VHGDAHGTGRLGVRRAAGEAAQDHEGRNKAEATEQTTATLRPS